MKLKPVIFAVLFCCAGLVCSAQTATDSTSQTRAKKAEVEKVDGVWALSSYLGKKLVREFSSRLNLDRDETNREPQPVTVAITVGSFRVERTEFR
ncbi:MAG: hypothetical protein LC670_06135 [Flavobacteriales bacterium]|nr:hypothetical protein [Flavobacteriales bacterium]